MSSPNTPTPPNTPQEKPEEKKISRLQSMDFPKLLKPKNRSHRMSLLRQTIKYMRESGDRTAALMEMGQKAFTTGGASAASEQIFLDSLKEVTEGTCPDIVFANSRTDSDSFFAFFKSGSADYQEVQEQLASEYMIIDRQKTQLEQRIRKWYDIDTPDHLTSAELSASLTSLSANAISRLLASTPALTTIVKKWHTEKHSSDAPDFADKKQAQVKKIAEKAGVSDPDERIDRICEHIEHGREIPTSDLMRLLSSIKLATEGEKREMMTLLKPTMRLDEYLKLTKKDPKNLIDALVQTYVHQGHISDATKEAALKDRLKAIIDTPHVKKLSFDTEFLFDLHTDPANAGVFTGVFGTYLNEALTPYDDMDEFDERENFDDANQKTLDLLGEYSDSIRARSVAEEGNEAKKLNKEEEETEWTQAKAELDADRKKLQHEAVIKELGDLGIDKADLFKNTPEISSGSIDHSKSIFLVFHTGKNDRYVEITGYDAARGEIEWISHSTASGGYAESGDDTKMRTPVSVLFDGLKRQAVTVTKDSNSIFTEIKHEKAIKGSLFSYSDIQGLIDSKKIKKSVTENTLTRSELELKLKNIDNKTVALSPGLLIQTGAVDKDGKKKGKLLIEVTSIDEAAKTITINTALSPTGAQDLKTLSFSDFLDQFALTDSVRMGRAETMSDSINFVKDNNIGDLKNLYIDQNTKTYHYKNEAEKDEFEVDGFVSGGDPKDHIIIESQDEHSVSYYYIVEGKTDDDGNLLGGKDNSKAIYHRKDVSYKFLMHELANKRHASWTAKKKTTDDSAEKAKHDHDEHHHDHHLHTHGGPLQWLAHGKNFGHFFKGIGMIVDDLKHFIEHGDEHVAAEMKYKVISWMQDEKRSGLIRKFMPTEIYLDMKSEIEAKIAEGINKNKDKWGKLSTGNVGDMAIALLADKYTTNEQMFGIIMALHSKVGTLYGIPSIQKFREKHHSDKIKFQPYPLFLYKLCLINKDDPVAMINKLTGMASKGGTHPYEGGVKPIPEMYMIAIYSQTVLQKQKNPPPVPGSYHAKLHAAMRSGEREQREGAKDGEANMYATTDQIEKRMYMLAKDGEVAQAIGFYERMIPRGAPMKTLLGLPFVLATSELRGYMSTELTRHVHINSVYEHGFASTIFTALESQQKYDNFQGLLKKLATKEYLLNGEPVLSEVERSDLAGIFDKDKWIVYSKEGKKDGSSLENSVRKAQDFWAKHGEKMMRIFNATDDNLTLLQLSEDIPEAKMHLQNAADRTTDNNYNAKLPAFNNGYYGDNVGSFAVVSPAEAANSFQGVDRHTGKFRGDDNGQMHESIFLGFEAAFRRVRNIENEAIRQEKFYEMTFQILKKITNTFDARLMRELQNQKITPNWYAMLQRVMGLDLNNWSSDAEMDQFRTHTDINFRAKAQKEYSNFMRKQSAAGAQGNVQQQVEKIINPFE